VDRETEDAGGGTPFLEVVFFDVGHGCCTAVVTPYERRVVLVDCNAGSGPATLSYLEEHLSLPHVVFVSHLHQDHIAGFADIFRYLIEQDWHVDRVYANYAGHTGQKRSRYGGQAAVQQLRDLLDGDDARLRDFRVDEPSHVLDHVCLTVLHPDKFDLHTHQDRDEMANDLSGVLRVSFGKSSVVLPGDIQGWGASRLLARWQAADLQCSLLLFPHHGAGWEAEKDGRPITRHGEALSSTATFLEAAAPKWSVLSVGSDNDGNWDTYRHPRQPVFDLLRKWHNQHGEGFICTEATRRCSPDLPRAASSTGFTCVRVPCGGCIRFLLSLDGTVAMHPTTYRDWRKAVNGVPRPQCPRPRCFEKAQK